MTKWEYATVEYNIETEHVGLIKYGPDSPMEIDRGRNEAFVKAREASLLAVLDLMGAHGWEMIGNVFGTDDRGYFMFKRPSPDAWPAP